MKITVLTVGKIKEKYLADGIAEYSKRLSRYCKLEIIQVADEKTVEGASRREEEMVKEKEGSRLIKYLKEDAHVVALAIDGKQYSSEEFADKIDGLGMRGTSHIVFVIGGSLGLSDEVLGMADEKISFSRMTFPHQLMRLVLLEQVYRGYRIIHGEPYHK